MIQAINSGTEMRIVILHALSALFFLMTE